MNKDIYPVTEICMSSLSEWIKLHIITEIVLLMYRNNLTDTVKK